MIQFQRATWSLLAGAVLLGGCSDPLEVDNRNQPDVATVLRLPRDVESLAGRLYQNVHSSTVTVLTPAGAASNEGLYPQMLTMGLENASQLNNFGMGPRASIPRQFIDNARGNSLQAGNHRNFQRAQNTAQIASAVLARLSDTSFTIGTASADTRAKSFGYFGLGTAVGIVALTYDSASIARPGIAADSVLPLEPYTAVMAAALAYLDTAQTLAEQAAFTGTVPAGWLAAASDVPKADYIRLIRSYKARFRAQVARDSTERKAVNWPLVIADATNGISADFQLQLNPGTGWDYVWLAQHFTTGSGAWHTMTPYIVGMADTTVTRFNTWLATPRDNRVPFLINTPDKRFPAGADRAAQLAANNGTQYFRNRPPGEDVSGAAWGNSFYEHFRWRPIFNAGRIGAWTTFSKAENDMYAAEGHIRTGNFAAAATLINVSRTKFGLPPVPATATLGAPLQSPGCVPRVPDPAAGYVATKCGDILEAMKWESRMESAYASYGAWYLNGRGWGDLPEGTPVHWPVPFQEADARGVEFKNIGGVGQPGGAPASVTYGFGSGQR